VAQARCAAPRTGVAVQRVWRSLAAALQRGQSAAQRQALPRLPAVEWVRVVGQQGQQVGIAAVKVQQHRRGEAAQDRGHRCFIDVDKGDGFAVCRHARTGGCLAAHRPLSAGLCSGKAAPVAALSRPRLMGMTNGFLLVLSRRGRAALVKEQGVGARLRVVLAAGRAAWGVPAWLYQRLNWGSSAGQRRAGVGVGDWPGQVVAGDAPGRQSARSTAACPAQIRRGWSGSASCAPPRRLFRRR